MRLIQIRPLISVASFIGWLTVALRLYLAIQNSVASNIGIFEGIVTWSSYFTVLTNILAASTLIANSIKTQKETNLNWALRFLRRPEVNTAVATYISVVALIYHFILRHLFDHQGLAAIVNISQHYLMPGLFMIYWWFGVPKQKIKWRLTVPLLYYPLCYLVYILILGSLRNSYPYPFMDVVQLGGLQVAKNSMGVLIFFMAVSSIFIILGQIQRRH